jgi:hypothetical protein
MMAVAVTPGEPFVAGEPELLFQGMFDSAFYVHPDGNRFLMVQPMVQPMNTDLHDIHMMVNWFETLKRLVPTSPN